jgi:putative transposase
MTPLHKPRLRRLDWLYTDSPAYYLTACVERKRTLLANTQIHEAFIGFAEEAARREVYVGRYTIMPDHVHLFAALSPRAPALSKWMKALKGTLSEVLRELKVTGPYWEKGFFDHVLRSEESYAQKWLYVRENPVRGGLVAKSEDWPFQGELFSLSVRKKL